MTFEPLAKFTFAPNCHSERSEESRSYKGLGSFTSFRMTKPTLLQEPLFLGLFSRGTDSPDNNCGRSLKRGGRSGHQPHIGWLPDRHKELIALSQEEVGGSLSPAPAWDQDQEFFPARRILFKLALYY